MPYCPPHARHEMIEAAGIYEHRMTQGQKPIFHLEAFVLAFMDIFVNSQNQNAMQH